MTSMQNLESASQPSSLRRRAENALQGLPVDLAGMSTKEIQRVIHELQVHQIELEMQNENLLRTQRELEVARRKYTNLYEYAPIGYFTLDRHGYIVECNLTGAELLGVDQSELRSLPFGSYIHREHSGIFFTHRRDTFASRVKQVCEVQVVPKGRAPFEAQLQSIMVMDDLGEMSQIRTAVIDVTEQKLVEERLRQQEKMAAVGQLAGGIAHDFNNILLSVVATAEVLLKHPKTNSYSKPRLDRILQQSQRAARLVAQLLDFSRRSTSQQESIELGAFFVESLEMLKRTISESIYIKFNPAKRPFWITADAVQLQQVLLNLAVNSSYAMPKGGVFSIMLDEVVLEENDPKPANEMEAGRWYVVSIRDTGCGISADHLNRVMEPFFTTKPIGEGTGLGLSQVYGIMRQHRGHIAITSQPERGTMVNLYFPAIMQEKLAEMNTTSDKQAPMGSGETILLVEDDQMVLEPTSELLQSLGYQVITASNGKEGFGLFRKHRGEIDLVICDMVMPEMDGADLIEALATLDAEVRTILITGYSVASQMKRVQKMQHIPIIQKPFTINRMAQVIHSVLNAS